MTESITNDGSTGSEDVTGYAKEPDQTNEINQMDNVDPECNQLRSMALIALAVFTDVEAEHDPLTYTKALECKLDCQTDRLRKKSLSLGAESRMKKMAITSTKAGMYRTKTKSFSGIEKGNEAAVFCFFSTAHRLITNRLKVVSFQKLNQTIKMSSKRISDTIFNPSFLRRRNIPKLFRGIEATNWSNRIAHT